MEPQISPEYLKQIIYSILPEVLEQYYKEREKELSIGPLLERLVRIEEELKSLGMDMNTRFEAVTKEMNASFEAQTRESDARFEALEKRLNFLQWLIVFGFTFMSVIITLLNFFK